MYQRLLACMAKSAGLIDSYLVVLLPRVTLELIMAANNYVPLAESVLFWEEVFVLLIF